MEGHTHFRYGTSSALARPIIHGGRSLIAYSIVKLLYNSGNHSAVKQYNYYLHCEGFTHTFEIVKVQGLRVELQC